MTPTRFRECREALAWSIRNLADQIQVDERMVRRWEAGQYAIPEAIGAWLERLARFHQANPPPERTRRRTVAAEAG